MSAADSLKSTGNPVLDELLYIMISRFEHLVERGFLAPHFLNKMIADPTEILKFLRQNRAVVGDQLNRRLNPSIRPTPQQLEQKGIVPAGYFSYGHDIAMKKKHRRRSTAGQDLAMMIQLRPKPQDIINKGIAKKQEMEEYIDIKHEEEDDITDLAVEENINNISIISRLLFATISEALKRSCADTTAEEQSVLCEMQEMNHEMKILRDTLDKYFLSATPDISLFQEEEDMVRDKFHGIQTKLLHISTKQNNIHEKLKILHSVERCMIELQNLYDKQMSELQKNEEKLLSDVQQLRIGRDKAMAIMLAERSHRDWAQAKLTYTIESFAEYADESEDAFAEDLSKFLNDLQKISTHQKQIVSDYDFRIEELEQTLMRIRHDEGKVRNMTFKKIYDLHKQVQIAESLEFGLTNRRLSVATATELEKERNHNQTKIHRQLSVLNNYPLDIMPDIASLSEMVDIQLIMSDKKLKAFFAVFIQIFNQTVCDIELMFRNLNSKFRVHLENGVTTKQHLDKITNLCMSLYGINNIVNKIEIVNDKNMTLSEKLKKCMRFINRLKRAIAKEYKVDNIVTYKLNVIIIYIARKLCVNEHMVDEIEKTHDQQVPRLAIIRCNDIFQAILTNQKIFDRKPKNIKQAANQILENVFGIDHNNDVYVY